MGKQQLKERRAKRSRKCETTTEGGAAFVRDKGLLRGEQTAAGSVRQRQMEQRKTDSGLGG